MMICLKTYCLLSFFMHKKIFLFEKETFLLFLKKTFNKFISPVFPLGKLFLLQNLD